ncbi:MAG: hypothetical protein IIU05_03830 [Bacteroidales bacterium]|nr:hypothetical protein [Bacteroidales bacterium]
MAGFGWFGDQEHRVFNYKPIYYDEEKEKRRQMFGKVDGSAEAEQKSEGYTPGSYIQGAFRNGNYARKRGATRAQSIIGIVGLLLVAGILIFFTKFYALF